MADVSNTASEVYYMTSGETRYCTVNMVNRMNDQASVLTGTPTAAQAKSIPSDATALTIASVSKNAAALTISGKSVAISGAIVFSITAGQDGGDYWILCTGVSTATVAETVKCHILVRVRD